MHHKVLIACLIWTLDILYLEESYEISGIAIGSIHGYSYFFMSQCFSSNIQSSTTPRGQYVWDIMCGETTSSPTPRRVCGHHSNLPQPRWSKTHRSSQGNAVHLCLLTHRSHGFANPHPIEASHSSIGEKQGQTMDHQFPTLHINLIFSTKT
jgi:hypothetical protein